MRRQFALLLSAEDEARLTSLAAALCCSRCEVVRRMIITADAEALLGVASEHEPRPRAPRAEPKPAAKATQRIGSPALEVRCPWCGAGSYEACETPDGVRLSRAHKMRRDAWMASPLPSSPRRFVRDRRRLTQQQTGDRP